MLRLRVSCLSAALVLLASLIPAATQARQHADPSSLTLDELEERMAAIEAELERLAELSLRSGVGSIGFSSQTHENPNELESFEVHLSRQYAIDQVIIVPSIWRDPKQGLRADGFPLEFKVIAGSEENPAGTVLASFKEEDGLLPRIAPLVIECRGIPAEWVRVEATKLTPRAWDGRYELELAEILVFSGQENVALHQEVRTSTDLIDSGARKRRYLVDGFMPYFMDSALGEKSLAWVGQYDSGFQPSITIDLGESLPISRLQFHMVDLDDTYPQSTPTGFGIPERFVVLAANNPDFSDSEQLLEFAKGSVYETGPIIARRFPAVPARFLRLLALEPYLYKEDNLTGARIGFAEIEAFANHVNVAKGKPVVTDINEKSPGRRIDALTDGLNFYGQILPVRDWLNQLARRHDLEVERGIVASLLASRYAEKVAMLRRMSWLAAALGAGLVVTFLINRILQIRQLAKVRERFAADLHDELGATLHTIGLLSDIAQRADDNPGELKRIHSRIRELADRTGKVIRNFADIMQTEGLYKDIREDMERASRRILSKLDNDITVQGIEHIQRLRQQTRVDLFLFFQECLVNISRHSGATRFTTRLEANRKEVSMTIQDNGRGLGEAHCNTPPPSLHRRAKLLGGRITVDNPPDGGTRIRLRLTTRKLGLLK